MFIILQTMKSGDITKQGGEVLKDRLLALRLTGEEFETLEAFCRHKKVSKSEAVRSAFLSLVDGH